MKAKRISFLFLVLALSMLAVMVSSSAVSADSGSQVWYLDSDSHNPMSGKYVMEKAKPGEQQGTVTIGAGESQIWLADEAALADVTIKGGIWTANLCTQTFIWPGDLDARVGYYDGGTFHQIPTLGYQVWAIGYNNIEFEFQIDPATIQEGHYLALEVMNNDTQAHIIRTGECQTVGKWHCSCCDSWLRSPCADPGYPLPELSTIVLLGVGLVGLLGYLGIRRRKAS